jgi:hypothetical protein
MLTTVVEEMIDDMTSLHAYETYVHFCVKKDIIKTRNSMIKSLMAEMCAEISKEELEM